MTVFEYLMVMTSIILAIALTQLLRGLTDLWSSDRRYVPHTAWVVIMILNILQIWWGYWDLHEGVVWTAITFLYVLLLPALLFLATNVLLPFRRSDDMDWQTHFYSARRQFFLLLTVFYLAAILISWAAIGLSLLHPYRAWQTSLVLCGVVGLFTDNRTVHRWLPVVYILVLTTSQALYRLQPGAFEAGG